MTLSDTLRAAVHHVGTVLQHDLTAWHQRDPASEAVPAKDLVRFVRDVWPTRQIVVDHQRKPGHAVQHQAVIVVPVVMLRALQAEMVRRGFSNPLERYTRYELEE